MKWSVLVVLALLGAFSPAFAAPGTKPASEAIATDDFTAQRRYRTVATRLEVFPSSRQVRRCVDWYQIEHRPSGTVLTPQMRCWWARR
jgi:hypothetical protein